MDANENRRRFPRIPLKNAVLVELLGDRVGEQLARTKDLSVGGCMFFSQRAFPVGSVIQIFVKIDFDVVEAVARVVYAIPTESGSYDIGAEFVVINELAKSRILALFE